MNNNTLFSSVALFSALYDGKKDVYDVLAEFIIGSMRFSQKLKVNAASATKLLADDFSLSIPEAVVSTTLHNRLYKRDGILSCSSGEYTALKTDVIASSHLADAFATVSNQQEQLISKLILHVESETGKLNGNEISRLRSSFVAYLFDEPIHKEFSGKISAFIVKSQLDPSLSNLLDSVREGFVIYDGIRHSSDAESTNGWTAPFVVYLDTEFLFNAAGLNGNIYQKLFRDFYSLAYDVRYQGKRLISLKYFSETANEIDRFFGAAQIIVEGRGTLDPSKPAMISIVEKCKNPSDVLIEKAKFITEIQKYQIVEDRSSVTDFDPKYNLSSSAFLEKFKSELEAKGKVFEFDKCSSILNILTKINALRGAKNNGPLESSGFVFLSGSQLVHLIAHHSDIKSGDFPLALNLDYLTNRLWFKSLKGLTKRGDRPESLRALAKAQVVLSNLLNYSISEKFDSLMRDYREGRLSTNDAQICFHELRAKSISPESITIDSVDNALDLLDHSDYLHHLRERESLSEDAKNGRKAIAKLKEIQILYDEVAFGLAKQSRILDKKSSAFYSCVAVSLVVLFVSFSAALVLSEFLSWIFKIKADADTDLTVLGVIIACLSPVLALIKIKSISRRINKLKRAISVWLYKRSRRKKMARKDIS